LSKKPIYLSNSGINSYLDCGYKYKLHYIDRIRMNYTKSSFVFGSAVDNAVEIMLNNLSKDYEDPYLMFTDTMWNYDINGEKKLIPKTSNCKYSKADVQLELLEATELKNITDFMVELGYDMSEYSVEEFWKYYKEEKRAIKRRLPCIWLYCF
jgi:hypothetical protein